MEGRGEAAPPRMPRFPARDRGRERAVRGGPATLPASHPGRRPRIGPPLEPARATASGVSQIFRNASISLREDLRDTPYYVQPEPLGVGALRDLAYGGAEALAGPVGEGAGQRFPETGHSLRGAFLDFWERGGGLEVFGLPLSEEFTAIAADGQPRITQYLERAVLAFYPEDGGVRLEPLGARTLALERLKQPAASFTVR